MHWLPFTRIQEQIQRNFTRYALDYLIINYKERCEYLNILPLFLRREMVDNKQLFKSLFVSRVFWHCRISIDWLQAWQ